MSTDPSSPNDPSPKMSASKPDSGSSALHRKLLALEKKVRARQAELAAHSECTSQDRSAPTPNDASNTDPRSTPSLNRTAARSATVQYRLLEMEQQGLFNTYPITAQNDFPTLLTRLPIFRPTHRSRQKKLLNNDNALEFETSFGTGKRHGPLLTVRDEDTLIAIMRLRDRRLQGRSHNLPIPVPALFNDPLGNVLVHCILCTVQDLNKEKRLSDGGENYKATLASIKRLAATSIELNVRRHERYFGQLEHGTTIRMLDVLWEAYESDGLLLMQLPPVITSWLEREYTYIDWNVRLQLTDLGKSLHRFLSSQPAYYRAPVLKIAASIGYDGPIRNVKPRFREALDMLRALHWLSDYAFEGTGRKQPLSLIVHR